MLPATFIQAFTSPYRFSPTMNRIRPMIHSEHPVRVHSFCLRILLLLHCPAFVSFSFFDYITIVIRRKPAGFYAVCVEIFSVIYLLKVRVSF